MNDINSVLNNFAPATLDVTGVLVCALMICGALLLLGLLGRLLFKRNSGFSKALGTTISVLMVYGITAGLLATAYHYQVDIPFTEHLPRLPFITLSGSQIRIDYLSTLEFPSLCADLVELMMLSFVIGVIGELFPKGKNLFTGILLRLVSTVLGLAAYALITMLFAALLPDFIMTYATVILLVVIIVLLAVTVFKLIIGTLLGIAVHPVIGAIYTFFVSHFVGSQISKAVLPTVLVTLLVYGCNHFGILNVYVEQTFVPALGAGILGLSLIDYLILKHL